MTSVEIKDQRSMLVAEKSGLVDQLQEIKIQMLHTLPRSTFAALEAKRISLIRQVQALDGKLSKLNAQGHKVANDGATTKPAASPDYVRLLVELRDGYQSFGADGTRSPTMRRMASEFALELTRIIKTMITRKTEEVKL
jgi:hypothetical protein